jgi:hypothetical protein
MDLRDEVAGTEGTIWLDHFLRTGFEMFTAVGLGGYVAEKAEGDKGWLFPVGDEVHELGYVHMFADMLDALDAGRAPAETFFDGYVVNAVVDACYESSRTKRWEPVRLDRWTARAKPAKISGVPAFAGGRFAVIKEEHLPDGTSHLILKDLETGEIVQKTKS